MFNYAWSGYKVYSHSGTFWKGNLVRISCVVRVIMELIYRCTFVQPTMAVTTESDVIWAGQRSAAPQAQFFACKFCFFSLNCLSLSLSRNVKLDVSRPMGCTWRMMFRVFPCCPLSSTPHLYTAITVQRSFYSTYPALLRVFQIDSPRSSTVSINTSAVLWHVKCSKRKQQVSPDWRVMTSLHSHIPEGWNLHQHRSDNPKISGATVLFPSGVLCVASRLFSKLEGLYHRVIYVGGPLKGPRSTTNGWHTHARAVQFSCINFFFVLLIAVSFTKLKYDFCLIYYNNQMENIKVNMSDHGTWSKHLTVH